MFCGVCTVGKHRVTRSSLSGPNECSRLAFRRISFMGRAFRDGPMCWVSFTCSLLMLPISVVHCTRLAAQDGLKWDSMENDLVSSRFKQPTRPTTLIATTKTTNGSQEKENTRRQATTTTTMPTSTVPTATPTHYPASPKLVEN